MALTGKIINLFTDKEMTIPAFPRTKVKAISDDNGIDLNTILEAKSDINHTHMASDIGALSMELLWENASPTSGDFVAQTINLDLSAYNYIMIEAMLYISSNVRFNAICSVGAAFTFQHFANASSSEKMRFVTRMVKPNETGITVETGYYKDYGASSGNTANSFMIPCKIYGIKGV